MCNFPIRFCEKINKNKSIQKSETAIMVFIISRSKANESELDVSDHFVDLDSSFKRMLSEKRQLTNKENNPPAAGAGGGADVDDMLTAINPPEKPLRKDLLKERKCKCCCSLVWHSMSIYSKRTMFATKIRSTQSNAR